MFFVFKKFCTLTDIAQDFRNQLTIVGKSFYSKIIIDLFLTRISFELLKFEINL